MEFVPIAVAGLMINTAMAALKAIRAKLYGDALTIFVAFLVGVGVAWLLSMSDFAAAVKVGTQSLADMNAASLVFVGFAMASVGRFAYQATKAVDQNQSAVEPKLFPPPALDG